MKIALPPSLVRLAGLLPAPLYVVGGYVRNALLWGRPVGTDVDICGPMTVDALTAALAHSDAEVVPVNPRVGTVLVRYQGDAFEYTTFRRDSYPIGGVHTPQSVDFVHTVEEDALRRDFCINALYADALKGEVIDPVEGLADLQNKTIRTTRAAHEVFAEDGLRILRMVRFAAELGFAPDADTERVAYQMRTQLADISPERRREELDKILLADVKYGVSGGMRAGVGMLSRLELWTYLLGEGAHLPPQDLPPILTVRLTALIADMALPNAEVRQRLGQSGLRYPNATVAEVVRLLDALAIPDAEPDWRLWAADNFDLWPKVCALWADPALTQRAQRTVDSLRLSGVPLTHKDLPITPQEAEALGVPQSRLGKVLHQAVRRCIAQLVRPDKRQCTDIILQIERENKWK